MCIRDSRITDFLTGILELQLNAGSKRYSLCILMPHYQHARPRVCVCFRVTGRLKIMLFYKVA